MKEYFETLDRLLSGSREVVFIEKSFTDIPLPLLGGIPSPISVNGCFNHHYSSPIEILGVLARGGYSETLQTLVLHNDFYQRSLLSLLEKHDTRTTLGVRRKVKNECGYYRNLTIKTRGEVSRYDLDIARQGIRNIGENLERFSKFLNKLKVEIPHPDFLSYFEDLPCSKAEKELLATLFTLANDGLNTICLSYDHRMRDGVRDSGLRVDGRIRVVGINTENGRPKVWSDTRYSVKSRILARA